MPSKPKIPCAHPNCPELVEPGEKYCKQHKVLHLTENRSKPYNAAWRKISKQFLVSHPLCENCKKNGKYTKATVVDHIIPHRGDPELFWDSNNWQALCKSCHDKKTLKEEIHKSYEY